MRGLYWEIISVGWVAFLVYWTLGVRRIRPSKRQAPLTFTIPNTMLLDAGLVLVLLGRVDFGVLAVRFVPASVWVDVAGVTVTIAGIGLTIWSRWVLGTNWSGAVRIVEGQRLIRSGPYAVVRNPIYSGIALGTLGTAFIRGTLGALLGVVLVVAAFWLKARVEERFLLAEFGDEYAAYKRAVKSLIPFGL